MKIAIATNNGQVAQHFGRCPKYTIVEIKDEQVKNKEIVGNPGHAPGALPKFLNSKDCQLIIAGGMGRKAQGLFKEFNIDWIIGVQGDVDCVIEDYINGKLESGESLCVRGEGKGDGRHRHHA
ncbi:MAG TPA: NifB/NifX family molybdenum-iron cluster-binding protein [bacterium]|nr:NifB/NifX family molybdenum-iron cluster-binding protein [bacterium]